MNKPSIDLPLPDPLPAATKKSLTEIIDKSEKDQFPLNSKDFVNFLEASANNPHSIFEIAKNFSNNVQELINMIDTLHDQKTTDRSTKLRLTKTRKTLQSELDNSYLLQADPELITDPLSQQSIEKLP